LHNSATSKVDFSITSNPSLGLAAQALIRKAAMVKNIIGSRDTMFQFYYVTDIAFIKFNNRVINKRFHILTAAADKIIRITISLLKRDHSSTTYDPMKPAPPVTTITLSFNFYCAGMWGTIYT